MTRARKACAHYDCPELQPCPEHQRKPWAGSTRRARLPADWERRRRNVLDRDPICNACHLALGVQVDHIHAGDNHAYTNLQGICERCHQAKTQTEAQDARRLAHTTHVGLPSR